MRGIKMCKWGDTKELIIDGKVCKIDSCIHKFVRDLNKNGYKTIASCCGHNEYPPSVIFMYKGERKVLRILGMEELDKLDIVLGWDIGGKCGKEKE